MCLMQVFVKCSDPLFQANCHDEIGDWSWSPDQQSLSHVIGEVSLKKWTVDRNSPRKLTLSTQRLWIWERYCTLEMCASCCMNTHTILSWTSTGTQLISSTRFLSEYSHNLELDQYWHTTDQFDSFDLLVLCLNFVQLSLYEVGQLGHRVAIKASSGYGKNTFLHSIASN